MKQIIKKNNRFYSENDIRKANQEMIETFIVYEKSQISRDVNYSGKEMNSSWSKISLGKY